MKDLKLGDKFTLVTRGEYAVATVKAPEGADTPAAAAQAAAAEKSPEVIKKGKEEADAKKAEAKK